MIQSGHRWIYCKDQGKWNKSLILHERHRSVLLQCAAKTLLRSQIKGVSRHLQSHLGQLVFSLCSIKLHETQKHSPTRRKKCGTRIFICSPPVAYKYIWVVAEADFKHIQKIAFGTSLKHCSAGELLLNIKLSFWIKCWYLLYLSRQITGNHYWQLGKAI